MAMTWLRMPYTASKLSTTSFVNVAMPHSRGGNEPMKSVSGGCGGNIDVLYCKHTPRKLVTGCPIVGDLPATNRPQTEGSFHHRADWPAFSDAAIRESLGIWVPGSIVTSCPMTLPVPTIASFPMCTLLARMASLIRAFPHQIGR